MTANQDYCIPNKPLDDHHGSWNYISSVGRNFCSKCGLMVSFPPKSKINLGEKSVIEVQALFLQFKQGNRESISRDLLESMIDLLMDHIKELSNNIKENNQK